MPRNHFLHGVLMSAGLGLVASGAGATVLLVDRQSTLSASYLFGAGPDITGANDGDSETSLTDRPSLLIQDGASDSGILNGNAWQASVTYRAEQTFSALVSAGQLVSLTSRGEVLATAGAVNAAVTMNVRNPGNRLELYFTVDAPTRYVFEGDVSDSNVQSTVAGVAIERQGLGWGAVPGTSFADTVFRKEGELPAGSFRVVGVASARADANDPLAASGWEFTLSFGPAPVPEPGTAMLGLAGFALLTGLRAVQSGLRRRR
jgi:hypothetical protein